MTSQFRQIYLANTIACTIGCFTAAVASILTSAIVFGSDGLGLLLVESIFWALPFGLLIMPLGCLLLDRLYGDQYGQWIFVCSIYVPVAVVAVIILAMQFGLAEYLRQNVITVFGNSAILSALLVNLVSVMPSCFVGIVTIVQVRKVALRFLSRSDRQL